MREKFLKREKEENSERILYDNFNRFNRGYRTHQRVPKETSSRKEIWPVCPTN